MKDPSEIKRLAYERLEEAEILYLSGKHDGAFYLAGYSVELMLKAKICERISVPNLFDEDDKPASGAGIGEVRRFFKTHNLHILLICSGLLHNFERDISTNAHLFKANSLLFGNWSENSRYKPCGFMKQSDVNDLLSLLKDRPDGLLLWIEKN